jgi:hypothetical protein
MRNDVDVGVASNCSRQVIVDKKVQQKRHSSKYLSAFLQAIHHQSRHPG